MQFREFGIIAAAAYAAHQAATGLGLDWDELSDAQQREFSSQVMAIARGESGGPSDVFRATAKAILGYNSGQGGLALEKIASIGNDHFNLGLVTEAQVAGRDISEVNAQLLHELAGLRQLMGALGSMAMHYAQPVVDEMTEEAEAETETADEQELEPTLQ